MLADIIANLEQMNHDELRDFIDYCEYHYHSKLVPKSDDDRLCNRFMKSVKTRRSGLPTGGFPDDWIQQVRDTKILKMTTELQLATKAMVSNASKQTMITLFGSLEPHSTKGAIAWVLLRSKAPVRLKSKGNIQVKHIPYKQLLTEIDKDTGVQVPVLDENGNRQYIEVNGSYLYLRYWTVRGDSDKKKTRYKNVYIGGDTPLAERRKGGYIYRMLADYFYDTIQEHGIRQERTVTDKKTGEIKKQVFMKRPKGDDNPIAKLEAKIMACVDMESNPPAIDYEALEQLQADVC